MQQALHKEEQFRFLETPDQISHRVTPRDVLLSKNARITVGMAAKEIAANLNIPEHEIRRSLGGEMYWLEPAGTLMIVLRTDEADMFIEIPAEHWRFRHETRTAQ